MLDDADVKVERICMNPECKDNEFLTTYNCIEQCPLIRLGKVCWNCKKSDHLVENKNES